MLNCGMGKECQGKECLECLNRRYATPAEPVKGMSQCYKIYVPAVDDAYLDKVESELLACYGGYTTYFTNGAWVSDAGEKIFDCINVYEVYTNKADTSLKRLAECIKHDLKQQCVSLVINNTMYFI